MNTLNLMINTVEICKANDANVYYDFVDVRDEEGIHKLVNGAIDRFGRIDVLVNNAANTGPGQIAFTLMLFSA